MLREFPALHETMFRLTIERTRGYKKSSERIHPDNRELDRTWVKDIPLIPRNHSLPFNRFFSARVSTGDPFGLFVNYDALLSIITVCLLPEKPISKPELAIKVR